MESRSKDINRKSMFVIMVFSIIAVFTMWVLTPILTSCFVDNFEQKGQIGDLFGSVNALFSGLAFAGMIITLWFQREELQLQREELSQTKDELKAQREEFEEQNKTFHRQRFENTFFSMLSLQEQITQNIDIGELDDRGEKVTGRRLFKRFILSLVKSYNLYELTKGGRVNFKVFLDTDKKYKLFNQYFRHVQEILKQIGTTNLIPDDERHTYVEILRSQLTDSELAILAVYALSSDGEKFFDLAKRYSFFIDFPKNILPQNLSNQLN